MTKCTKDIVINILIIALAISTAVCMARGMAIGWRVHVSTAVNMNLLFVSLHAGSGPRRSTTILRKGSYSIATFIKGAL